jgi:hypothetical protein
VALLLVAMDCWILLHPSSCIYPFLPAVYAWTSHHWSSSPFVEVQSLVPGIFWYHDVSGVQGLWPISKESFVQTLGCLFFDSQSVRMPGVQDVMPPFLERISWHTMKPMRMGMIWLPQVKRMITFWLFPVTISFVPLNVTAVPSFDFCDGSLTQRAATLTTYS